MSYREQYPLTMNTIPILEILLSCVVVLMFSGCATTNNPDPYEGANRKVMAFNDGVDKWVLKPVTKGYRAVTPKPVRKSVHNLFSNLNEPTIIINQFLQGNILLGLQDTARFLVNTTLGIVGLFDVASSMGMDKHNEDWGQTLGAWGVDSGAYLVIPFLGPATTRDGVGDLANTYTHPTREIDHIPTRNQVLGVGIIDKRSELLEAEAVIQGDRYLFIRDAYLQNREFLVRDGEIESDPFLEGIE